jgi:hypothetical protein
MAVQGSPTHSEDFSYVADSAALVTHSGGFTLLGGRQCGWPATDLAAFARGGEASVRAFAEQLPLERGEGTENVKDEFTPGGGSVDLFGDRCEPHSPGFQLGHEFDQVREVTAEPVEPPHAQGVSGQQGGQELVERGPRGRGPTRSVDEEPFTPERSQSVAL